MASLEFEMFAKHFLDEILKKIKAHIPDASLSHLIKSLSKKDLEKGDLSKV